MRFSTRFNWGDYSDGNRRLWGQVERVAARVVPAEALPRPAGDCVSTSAVFSITGYFNPEDYISGRPRIRRTRQAWERLSYDVTASWGAEFGHAGGSQGHSGPRAPGWRAGVDHFEIVAQYGYSARRSLQAPRFARAPATSSFRIIW